MLLFGRLEQTGRDTTSTLVISPVIETDTGDYECWARHKGATTNHDGSDQVKKILKVLIEPRRGACQPGQYQCEGKDEYCIATRFVGLDKWCHVISFTLQVQV